MSKRDMGPRDISQVRKQGSGGTWVCPAPQLACHGPATSEEALEQLAWLPGIFSYRSSPYTTTGAESKSNTLQSGWGWGSASLLARQGWVGRLGPASAVLLDPGRAGKTRLSSPPSPLSFV